MYPQNLNAGVGIERAMKYNVQSSEMEAFRGKARILLACHKPFLEGLRFARFTSSAATMQLYTWYATAR